MTQILQANANNISVPGGPLLKTGDKVVVTQREYTRIAKTGSIGTRLTDLGPGVFASASVLLSTVITDGFVVATINPGVAGRILDLYATVGTAATTAGKKANIAVYIDGKKANAGISLTSANATPAGKVVAGTVAGTGNGFKKDSVITLRAAGLPVAFVEGAVTFNLMIGPANHPDGPVAY